MVSPLQYWRFFPRFFCKKGLPLQLIFFVTSRCNLRCRHCFYWQKIGLKNKNELTLSEIRKFTDRSKLNLLWLSLTGGEPFLRSDLPEIASSFYKNGVISNISIPTNAQLKQRTVDFTKRILKLCPKSYVMVGVSLDGLEKTHDGIRGIKGSFSKAIETFEELKTLKKFPNFGLSIQTTIMEANQNEVKKLYIYTRDYLKPDYLNLNIIRGDPSDESMKKIDIRNYDELRDLMLEDVRNNNWPYFNFPLSKLALARNFEVYQRVSDNFKRHRFTEKCYSLSLSGVVDEKGDVFPCEVLSNSKVGDLRESDYDLSKIWFSEQAEEVRKKISNQCNCTYECALSMNTLFNLKFYKKYFFDEKKLI